MIDIKFCNEEELKKISEYALKHPEKKYKLEHNILTEILKINDLYMAVSRMEKYEDMKRLREEKLHDC